MMACQSNTLTVINQVLFSWWSMYLTVDSFDDAELDDHNVKWMIEHVHYHRSLIQRPTLLTPHTQTYHCTVTEPERQHIQRMKLTRRTRNVTIYCKRMYRPDTNEGQKLADNWLTSTINLQWKQCMCGGFIQLSWLWFNIMLDTLRVILEKIFPANLLTGAKHPAFSTNCLADIEEN